MTGPGKPAGAPSATASAPRWMRIALVLSLAVNLLVAGIVAGMIVTGGPGGRGGPDRRDVAGLYTRALDAADRRALRRAYLHQLRDAEGARGAVLAEFRDVLRILRSEPFDAAALQAALARQRARGAARQEEGQRLLAEVLQAMSPSERAAYADRLEEGLARLQTRRRPPVRE